MTQAANLLEWAKDNPAEYEHWYAQACRANELAQEWLAEAERLKPIESKPASGAKKSVKASQPKV
jgi:hypothetical protein